MILPLPLSVCIVTLESLAVFIICKLWLVAWIKVVSESPTSWYISKSLLAPNIALLLSAKVMSSPELTAISVPPVVFPFANTSDNSLLAPTWLSTYPLLAASVLALGVAGIVTWPPKLLCPVPDTVNSPVTVTSSGKPIVNVWPLAEVSISLLVPAIVNVWLSKSTLPVPLPPAKSKSSAVTAAST